MNQPRTPAHRHWIPWYVGGLVTTCLSIGALSSPRAVLDDPFLFAALFGFVLLLEFAAIDLFGNGSSSPSSIPAVAVAVLFGPFGAVLVTVASVVLAVVQRKPGLKVAFDFGALAVSGAAAAMVVDLVPTDGTAALLAAVALAGIVYTTANNLFILGVWHLDEGISVPALFRERLAWMWPYDVACGAMAALLVVTEQELGLLALAVFAAPMLLIWIGEKNQIENSRRIVAHLRQANEELAGANRQLHAALDDNRSLLAQTHRDYLSTITSLARTIEAKDPYTGGHTERVADIALALAIELGFDDEQLRAVQVGAIIHDIGKIGIPDAILLKPGRLSDEEFAEMRRHPEISSYILGELELPEIVKQMARHHHERFDGSGYPDRLAGEDIPLAARILTVADAYDAMTSDRPYRQALPADAARAEIESGAGTQFCPVVAATLTRCLDEGRFLDGPDGLVDSLPELESASG